MSLETDISKLTDEIMALQQRYQAKPDVFDRWLGQFKTSFERTIESLNAGTIWVDSVNGDDAHDGASGRPVKTLGAAVALIPEFGRGSVTWGGELDLEDEISVVNRDVRFAGSFIQGTTGSLNLSGVVNITLQDCTTALSSSDYKAPAFVQIQEAARVVIDVRSSAITLGDAPFISGAQYFSHPVSIAMRLVSVSKREGATATKLIQMKTGIVQFFASSVTTPSDVAFADLCDVGPHISNVQL